MEFDAFTAGIEPGGLRNKNEIRILICYLVVSMNSPLSKEDIVNIMQENGFANYFEVTDALSELSEHGNILLNETSGVCSACDSAHMIAKQLETTLPVSIRDKTVSAAINLLAKTRLERENKVELVKIEKGYHVVCHVSGGDIDLMSFTLYVPNLEQAKMVRSTFQKDPNQVYKVMLAAATGNRDLIHDLLK